MTVKFSWALISITKVRVPPCKSIATIVTDLIKIPGGWDWGARVTRISESQLVVIRTKVAEGHVAKCSQQFPFDNITCIRFHHGCVTPKEIFLAWRCQRRGINVAAGWENCFLKKVEREFYLLIRKPCLFNHRFFLQQFGMSCEIA